MLVPLRSLIRDCLRVAVALALAGCSKPRPLAAPAAPLTPPSRLCAVGEAPPACRSARQVEALLGKPLEILGMAPTPSGQQGAKILTLRAQVGAQKVVFRAKWRAQSSASIVNEPRKELAAYAVQKLFLDETELVVPPIVAHCFPLAEYRVFVPDERPSFDDIDCVFGFVSYWLESVQTASAARKDGLLGGEGEGFWDAGLFERDAMYRRSVANTNLLTYVIRHGDPHNAQFLLERTPQGLRTYVVDNSIGFRSVKNPIYFLREDWAKIRVPRLPKRSVERLRALTKEDFAGLVTVNELSRQGRQLVRLATPGPATGDESAMSWSGSRLRIGLTRGEIELVESRIRDLLARPDLASIVEP
jgi:hypothetical protein